MSEENPLLAQLPIFKDIQELARMLSHNPYSKINRNNLDLSSAKLWLQDEYKPYVPTSKTLMASYDILSLIRASYHRRDPTNPDNLQKRIQLLQLGEQNKHKVIPSSFGHSSSLIIKGITGMGKSRLIERTLKLLPDVIEHSENSSAGWICQTQIVSLYVELSHDGTRGGFLDATLMELDRKLGTNHSIEVPKKFRTIDKQINKLIAILHANYVGVLVVDEIQKRKIVTSYQAELMQLFLLSILNSGIPVILCGNPLGFSWVENFSQDVRRLTANPPVELHPLWDNDQSTLKDWARIASVIQELNVLPKPIKSHEFDEILHHLSGGIPGFALTLWRHAQNQCLVNSKKNITKNDLIRAYTSDSFAKLYPIAKGFSDQNFELFKKEEDIPWKYYQKLWLKKKVDTSKAQEDDYSSTNKIVVVKKPIRKRSEKSKKKAAKTRKINQELKRKLLFESLDEDDYRINTQEINLEGLDDMEKKYPQK